MTLTGWAEPVFSGRARGRVRALRSSHESTERLERIPPYLFAELERKIAQKKAAGVDVISLGIGDPDTPDAGAHRRGDGARRARPGHAPVPVEPRPRRSSARRSRASTTRRFGVELDPDTQVMPAIGGKECIFNLNLAFLDPGDVALAADPGYPVYTGGPLLAGAEPVLMPLLPERGFVPDLDAIPADALARARLMFLNYPNNPTGAVVPDGFFERGRRVRARARHARRARHRLLRADLRRLRGAELPRDAGARTTSASRSSRSRRPTT